MLLSSNAYAEGVIQDCCLKAGAFALRPEGACTNQPRAERSAALGHDAPSSPSPERASQPRSQMMETFLFSYRNHKNVRQICNHRVYTNHAPRTDLEVTS